MSIRVPLYKKNGEKEEEKELTINAFEPYIVLMLKNKDANITVCCEWKSLKKAWKDAQNYYW